jgi:hypothetical protein
VAPSMLSCQPLLFTGGKKVPTVAPLSVRLLSG